MLRLHTRVAYAVTAMLDIALNDAHGPVSLAKICARHKISRTYLETVFSKLMAHDLVNSLRGPGGGYTLSRSSEDISLSDIAFAVDESIFEDEFVIGESMRSEICADFNRQVIHHLSAINLRKLVIEQQEWVQMRRLTDPSLPFFGKQVVKTAMVQMGT